jgi:5-oxoprolinase (ATP-hydrolysing)
LRAVRQAAAGAQSVAVVLVNGPQFPAHELAVAKAIPSEVPTSLGHMISPERGYLARLETTLVDAAITPVLRAAIRKDCIPPGAQAMRSDGSLCPAASLRAPDAVLSGPAGGVLAVAAVAAQAGFPSAVGLDMGGTSTDVCRVDVGDLPRREADVRVAGVRVRRAQLEVDTIAAGGGSILRRKGVQLSVGPDSAGADPGPACYGRGGPPTLTDACLVAGLIDPNAFFPPLDPSVVDLPGEAHEFLALARESMAAAVSGLATARGISLSDHALVAYGGAAGQHAAHVAERLGIRTVLFHPCAGCFAPGDNRWRAGKRPPSWRFGAILTAAGGPWKSPGRPWRRRFRGLGLPSGMWVFGTAERTTRSKSRAGHPAPCARPSSRHTVSAMASIDRVLPSRSSMPACGYWPPSPGRPGWSPTRGAWGNARSKGQR